LNSIKDKLYSLNRKPAESFHSNHSLDENSLLSELNAQKIKNQFGEYVLREKIFPLDYKHSVYLKHFLEIQSNSFVLIAQDARCGALSPKDLLFFDTETTGLAGGSGTYAFLVGIGFLENNCFRIQQYFMHSFEAEKALLTDLLCVFQKFKAFVSFNGKSYDLPLLRNRFILNRLNFDWEQKCHIDLLHSSRRFWKRIYVENSLQALEKNVLGFKRLDDIPGAEIPKLFFDYLRKKSAKNIKPIMQHNVMDILSLVSLITIQNQIIQKPHLTTVDYDRAGLIKSYENTGRYVEANNTIDKVISKKKGPQNYELMLRQSFIFKRLKQYDKASEIWEFLLTNYSSFNPHVYIELAKYKEHYLKDYTGALFLINKLFKRIELLDELGKRINYHIERDEIKHRKERIIKKIKQQNNR
jgi:uncharacterized protein